MISLFRDLGQFRESVLRGVLVRPTGQGPTMARYPPAVAWSAGNQQQQRDRNKDHKTVASVGTAWRQVGKFPT